jgi:hypothetical protein
MDYKEIQNDKVKESLLKVAVLQKEYEVTLQQYQEAGQNYINTLQRNTFTSTSNSNTAPTNFAALPGRTWWGTNGVAEGAVNSQEECESMCANTENCSGATFNPVKRYCWARSGDNSVTPGTDNDFALIPKQKAALIVMKSLNDNLLRLNNQIQTELQNIHPDVQKQKLEKNIKQIQLNGSYQQLLEQKMEMDRQLQEYYSIDEENVNQSLYVDQQTSSLRLWVLITCLVLIVTIRKMFGLGIETTVVIWLLIIIILIVLTYTLSSPAGFLMWFIVLITLILMKTGNLPSP